MGRTAVQSYTTMTDLVMGTGDPIVDWALRLSSYIAFAWMIANGLVIMVGYYMRDRSHDND